MKKSVKSLRERIREALANPKPIQPPEKPTGEVVTVDFSRSYWTEAKWGADGKCYYREGKGRQKRRFKRRPEMDFGNPLGDLIIPPWAQECAKRAK